MGRRRDRQGGDDQEDSIGGKPDSTSPALVPRPSLNAQGRVDAWLGCPRDRNGETVAVARQFVAAASSEVWLGVLESKPWRSCHPYCISQRATHAPDDFNVVGSVDILTLLPFAL